ncbi:MAG: glycoside hydrolase family 28 protein [Paludibacteraceae bacterium]
MNIKLNFIFLWVVANVFASSAITPRETSKYEYLYKDLPFEMPRLQTVIFPNNQVNLLDFGGKPDGITLNTGAFEKAIKALSDKGGGTLIVPKGVWFTGPIVFRSNINLHLEKGALILFSPDFNLYPLVKTVFEGLDTRRCQSPISGQNLQNVAITGEGSINGYGEAWRPLKKNKVTSSDWKKITSQGGVLNNSKDTWYPSESSKKGAEMSNMNVPRENLSEQQWQEIKDFLRPVMISFIECKNVYLQGVLFENSPAWNIHPLMCENVVIDGIFSRNPSYAQNGDGLDVESCKNTIIVNSLFDSGDDGICIKSGKDEQGRKRARPTENVIVENCKVFQGHGGFVVGSEMSGGVRNISVKNCQFLGTDVGLRFKSTRGRGGVVENIYASDIYMNNIVTDSFLFDLYYGGKSASEQLEEGKWNKIEEKTLPVTEETPVFRNIFVNNIVSRNAYRAMYFNGLPEMKISNIQIENVFITAEYGAELINSNGVKFKNVHVEPVKGSALILKNVENFNAENFSNQENLKNPIEVSGQNSKNIKINRVAY